MVELLKFEYYRIFKSVFWWVMAAAAAIIPVLTVVSVMSVLRMITGDSFDYSDIDLTNANIRFGNWYVISYFYERIPLIIALFVPLFLGRDYKDGFIRNKLTAGHTRFEVFTSAVITQVSVTAVLSIIYILFAIISLLLCPLELNLHKGEMLVRALTLILSLCATTILFTSLSFMIKSRAAAVVLTIVFVFSTNIFAMLATNYSYNHRIIHEYGELYNEAAEKLSYDNVEEFDEDSYFNVGWYIGHPIFVLTNAGLGDELLPSVGITSIMMDEDAFSYTNYVYRKGFTNHILSALFTNNYMTYIIDSKDVNKIDGVEVKVSQVELEYNIKSVCWGAIFYGCGYAIFRKKNIF
ncbi:MAG: hypothetical protein J6127_03645 [Clostridiales bacterium]|nr:hypothetical protein [Clostridiales bacterium]